MSYAQADVLVVARTIWGEARGESYLGKLAVGWVIRNRVMRDIFQDGKPDWWGEGWAGVCQAPRQFSCWNGDDPNKPLMLERRWSTLSTDEVWRECLSAAIHVMEGVGPDHSGGACHYHAYGVSPKWARGIEPVAVIGRHLFFRLDD